MVIVRTIANALAVTAAVVGLAVVAGGAFIAGVALAFAVIG